MKVEVNAAELVDFADVVRRASDATTQDLQWAAELAMRRLKGEERAATPHGATGQAAAGWKSYTEVNGHEVVGIVENVLPYVSVLDRGEEAGPWRAMPPYRSQSSGLLQWVRRVLQLRGKEAKSVAFLIARKIRRRGFTRRHQDFAWVVWHRSKGQILATFDAALNRWAKRLT